MAADVQTTPSEITNPIQSEQTADVQPENMTTEASEIPKLTKDPEFNMLIPPLPEGENATLEEDIEAHGCRDPLTVWKDQGIILDGHHRFDICNRLGLPFKIVEYEFPNRNEAKIWMIKNQRGRRNLNESQRAMLAVTLEALYSEQAKERMGTRTDLGQDLDPSEAGRSAEKAAKDMGISHQTVSFAKKVATEGILELAKLVESGDVAVSAAARATKLPEEKQKEVVEEFGIQKRDGKNPNITAILRDIAKVGGEAPQAGPDERLEKFRRSQEAYMDLLEGIEATECPENLVEMLVAAETIIARIKEIEAKSLKPGQSLTDCSIIEMKAFKTFIQSLVPANSEIKLKFDSEGVRAGASDRLGYLMADAFLPKELFVRYKELGEFGLRRGEQLDSWMSVSLGQRFPGKKNIRLVLEPGNDSYEAGKLYATSGRTEFTGSLGKPEFFDECMRPQPNIACKVLVNSKDLLDELKTAKNFDGKVKFLVSEQSLKIVAQNDDGAGLVATPTCTILEEGNADSRFAISQFQNIRKMINKSKEVTLSLGMFQTMIMEMKVNGIAITYYIREESEQRF